MAIRYGRPLAFRSGSRPAFDKLKGQLSKMFGSAVQISGGPGRISSFEIYANGELIHSKLGGSPGKLDTAGMPVWTDAECIALSAKLEPLLTT